jgi:hypothetical protein
MTKQRRQTGRRQLSQEPESIIHDVPYAHQRQRLD